MDRTFATQLSDLNNRFYRSHAASFSNTRQAPWPGWIRAMGTTLRQIEIEEVNGPIRVLDLACGNMRFENFVASEFPEGKKGNGLGSVSDSARTFEFYGVDSCQSLVNDAHSHACSVPNLHFTECDVLRALMNLDPAETHKALFDAPPADLSVCFGFMHHVPGAALRRGVLQELVDATRAGGIVVVSFWQFMNDERLARKARTLTAAVRAGELCPELNAEQLDPNDYFLDWQSDSSVLRYCHHTTDGEIDRLLGALNCAQEVERYSADGRNNDLNRYVILKRN